YSILALPHFAWSGVFAALGIALTLIAIERGDLRIAVLAGLAWLGQASIHPQMPILMGGAVFVAMLVRPPRSRNGWAAAALAFGIPGPYILYSYFAFVGNPEVQRWTFHSKNSLPPEGFSFLFAIAPQLLLALTGLPGALRRRTREDVFLVAWLVLLAAILYLPKPAREGAGAVRLRDVRGDRQRLPGARACARRDPVAVRDHAAGVRRPHVARWRTAGPRALDARHRPLCARVFARHRLRRALRRDLRLLHEDADGARRADRQAGHRAVRPGQSHPLRDLDLGPAGATAAAAGRAGLRHPDLQGVEALLKITASLSS